MKRVYFIVVKRNHISKYKLILILLPIICFSVFFMLRLFNIDVVKEASLILTASSDTCLGDGTGGGGKLAIIIDDFGQNRRGVKEMMSINRHLTFAVMPFMTYSQSDAQTAHKKGYEVIVHLPMESNGGKPSWVGPRPILTSMSSMEVKQVVYDAFENIPYAAGANIHMGSKAGGDRQVISSILDVIREKGVYFVDSRSCYHPVAKSVAVEKHMTCYERDVFLDGKKPKSYIINQLAKAGDIALKKGTAIAIGHVGTEGGQVTAEAIAEMLPEFDRKKIKLVFISELFGKV